MVLPSEEIKTVKGGLLFAIEGIDGAGKTTHAKMLKLRLKDAGFLVELFHEPTSSEWGQKIRELAHNGRNVEPKVELEYFIEDRKLDVMNNIQPALNRNAIVIMDRYYISNVAYQGALGISIDEIFEMNEFAPEPAMIVILDVASKIGLTRVKKRENGRPNHFEDPDYLKKVRDIFRKLENRLNNVQVIDASRPLEEVEANVWNICYNFIRKKMGH